MNRRELLSASTASGLLGLAGCLSRLERGGDDGGGTSGDDVPGCTQREEWPDEDSGEPEDPPAGTIASRRDCADAIRPERTGTVCATYEPRINGEQRTFHSTGVEPYPDPPDRFDDETVISFVSEYERAYTHNRQVARYRSELTGVGVGIEEERTRLLDVDVESTVVRIHFGINTSTRRDGEHPVSGDGFGAAVYGVDETGIVRAEADYRTGEIDDADSQGEPDPIEVGALLECF